MRYFRHSLSLKIQNYELHLGLERLEYELLRLMPYIKLSYIKLTLMHIICLIYRTE